ncbi:aspartyl-phosphate phosphatase Spo0E family protein [Sporosarcina sp. NPDC096371]|uniref:aspartyl-phosphate phosphatase Spo0E family protein n=1 Tax=Sporosarcina sp. NPDC096371 TaxID=3364530 RepID=UPI0037F431FE
MERNVKDEIELMRKAMVETAEKHGLTAEKTIAFSRKLDNLINEYNKQRDCKS